MDSTVESTILKEISGMKTLLTDLNTTMTEMKISLVETNGKLKGNHELILQELHSYTHKDICEKYREHSGDKITGIEKDITAIQASCDRHFEEHHDDKTNVKDAMIAWMPDIVKALIWGSIVLYVITSGKVSL